MKIRILLLFFFSLAFSANVCAQENYVKYPFDTAATYSLELKDGSIFIGKFISKQEDNGIFKTVSTGEIKIPLANIIKVERIATQDFVNGQYWFANPNATRYFFGPSAFNLKAGEGYYQNTYLLLNSFNVGLTDNISVGAGIELLSTFGVSGEGVRPLFFFTPKVGFEAGPKVHLGGGVLYASVPDFGGNRLREGFGIGYAIGTYGTENHNVTGGIGWGYMDGGISEKPIFTISATTRTSRRLALVTENWIIPNDNGGSPLYISYGLRFFGEKISVDLAFINSADIVAEIPIGIPYVDFVVKF